MSASAEADPMAVNILTKKSLPSNVWTLRYRIFGARFIREVILYFHAATWTFEDLSNESVP